VRKTPSSHKCDSGTLWPCSVSTSCWTSPGNQIFFNRSHIILDQMSIRFFSSADVEFGFSYLVSEKNPISIARCRSTSKSYPDV
jgi:hypothetical protein